MAWLDGWNYRVPIAVDNSTSTAATRDVSIPLPADFDHFWDTIDASGDELRITEADGFTPRDYQLAASPAFNKSTQAGTIEVDNLPCNASAGVALCWLYYGNSGAGNGEASFTAATIATGYIHRAVPRAFIVGGRPVTPGLLQPQVRVQKTAGERIWVWFEMRGMLERRAFESSASKLWEECQYVISEVTTGGSAQAAMIEQGSTRFVETRNPPGFLVGVVVKAGTTATDYTIEPVIETYAPEITLSGTALVAGAYRTLEPRAFLTVENIDED